ncbi:MAG: DUF222 domain-containing protein [Actinomycetota bacterium]
MFARTLASQEMIDDACDALLEADRLTAKALHILSSTDVEAAAGLPAEILLALQARRTGPEARFMAHAAAALRAMPATSVAFMRGDLSWGQVRAIVSAVRALDADGRLAVDELICRSADALRTADPDELIARVDDAVARAREDLAIAREDRRIEGGFLAVQGRFDGSASVYGEADAESTATLLEALDAHAENPVAPEEDGPSRASQRFDALIAICESSLNGGRTDTTRARPRVFATIDFESLSGRGGKDAARILWSLAGRPARLTPLATEALLCDSTIVPVVFRGAHPLAVGDASSPISQKMRSALIARDGGCRFPGCRAPVSWCDAHHIRARIHDGPTTIDNLLLLCRRCHRRVHRSRWRIEVHADDPIHFTRRGRTYSSSSRARRRE